MAVDRVFQMVHGAPKEVTFPATGVPAIETRVQVLEGDVTALEKMAEQWETLRKLSIGAPKYHRSTTLPSNHAWPDGSFVEFEDWPELAEVYEQGGFTGMLLPWDADAATQAANLGKYRPNSANPTGLYLPLHGRQFLRNWTGGDSEEAGAWQTDCVGPHNHDISSVPVARAGYGNMHVLRRFFNGNMSPDYDPIWEDNAFGAGDGMGAETVPRHIWQPVIIYLGRPR